MNRVDELIELRDNDRRLFRLGQLYHVATNGGVRGRIADRIAAVRAEHDALISAAIDKELDEMDRAQ